ncbi:MAG: LysR family transcriptional regulator [Gammaproteobacteria bacterium]|nr:LysR family transcriptional regulator [Gammaproteobacteria bacterium]
MDKLTSMEVFLSVAREGSFTRAADELGMSKAMVSKHIKSLEDELGVRLLNRTTHGVSVTDSGRIFEDRSRSILDELSEAIDSIRDFDSTPHGTLRVAAPSTLGTFHITPAVAEYIQRYPSMRVQLALRDAVPDIIEEGFDVVIQVSRPQDSSLAARKLTTTRMVCCAAPEYLAEYGTPETTDDLKVHNCLRISTYRVWRFIVHGAFVDCHVDGNFITSIANSVRHAAVAGLGIAYLPTYIVANDIEAGRLNWLLRDLAPVERDIFALFPHRRHLSAKVQRFLDLLTTRMADSVATYNVIDWGGSGARE